jgi:uncharacterized protein (DUF2236 family)
MAQFVKPDSIVRKIWSDTDCILFIFGACAGEFAHSKAVDWLFFTGKLPNDPIGRLFSTVTYAQQIIFSGNAEHILKSMTRIHRKVEEKRGYSIPNEAYQDVLFMLIDYTARVYELVDKPLLREENDEIYDVFKRIGEHMEIQNLPEDWSVWKTQRQQHLKHNYSNSLLTEELFKRYKLHLGSFRYTLLLAVQSLLLEQQFLKTKKNPGWLLLFHGYKACRHFWPVPELKFYLLPQKHQQALRNLSLAKSKTGCPFSRIRSLTGNFSPASV